MIEIVKKSIRCALIVPLTLGPLAGVASAQERQNTTQDIRNVQLVFDLVQANGFTDEDPEIADVVTELRMLFNFRGYRLLSTSVLNVGLARQTNSSSSVTGSASQRIVPGDYETPLAISAEVSARRSTRVVRAKVILTDVTSRVTGNAISRERLPLLEASVTIRDGQRVVLGSARRSAEEPVFILIVTPRIDPERPE